MKNNKIKIAPTCFLGSLGIINGIKFTLREFDIIACILSGRSIKTTASFLSITPRTAETHVRNIMRKVECNSQEGIRDFVEKSERLSDIKQHYLNLLAEAGFRKLLQGLSKQTTKIPCRVLSSRSANNSSGLLESLVEYLKLAGIVVQENSGTRPLEVSSIWQEIDPQREGHILYILNEEDLVHYQSQEIKLPKRIPATFQKPSKFIFVIQSKNSISNIPDEIKEIGYVTFQDLENYYFSLIELLRKLLPNVSEVAISEFKRQYDIIQSNPQHLFTQIDLNETVKSKRTYYYILSVLLILITFFVIAVWFLGFHKPKTDLQNYKSTLGVHEKSTEEVKLISSWNLPILPHNYVERTKLTDKIWGSLLDNHTSLKIVGISGTGGVGKTFLAMYCIHNPRQAYKFRAWFNAESPTLLRANYFELGEQLQLFIPNMSDSQKIRAIKKWIEENVNSLLVYDNVSSIEELYEYLPNNAHIIITSRDYKIPNAIEMGVMTENESIKLLQNLVPELIKQSPNIVQESANFVRELNYFPLAISQAAAYITENVIAIPDYLKLYAKERKSLLSNKALPPGNQHEPIYVTWDMNLESINRTRDGQQALHLLNVISFCYPENIPKFLLKQVLYGTNDEKKEIEFNTLIGILRKYSLISVTTSSISIHRLVSDWLRDKLKPEEHLKYMRKALTAIEDIYPKRKEHIEGDFPSVVSNEKYSLIQLIFPHLDSIRARAGGYLTEKEKMALYSLYADACYIISEISRSNYFLTKLVDIKRAYFSHDNVQLVQTLQNLALTYRDLGEAYKAEAILKEALDINMNIHGEDHVDNIVILNRLAATYHNLGEGLKSLKVVEKSLAISKHIFGIDNTKTADALLQYGVALMVLGELPRAKEMLSQALNIKQKQQGANHIDTIEVLYTLGWVDYTLGNQLKGKEILEHTLTAFSHQLQPISSLAYNEILLGFVCYDLGDLEASKKLFLEAFKIRKKLYGSEHIWTAFSMVNLALVSASKHEAVESKELLEGPLKLIDKDNYTNNVWYSFLLSRIGIVYSVLGEYLTSKNLLVNALEKIKLTYGYNHIFTALVSENLGNVYRLLGDTNKSEEILRRSLDIIEKTYGYNHPVTAKAMANLALTLEGKEKKDMLKKALKVFKNYYSDDHIHIKNTLSTLESIERPLWSLNRSKICENNGYIVMLPF